ncbi:MAG: hypothetical protein OEZ02_13400 [Anaerolineae bacterium]|nr:hypothetical protein [Anaerolineae bacterium]
MKIPTSIKIAAITLILFGIFELMGLIILVVPEEYIPKDFETQTVFWALLSSIFGINRIIAGIAIWSNKKWGMVYGLMLSLTTMIVAPTIIPFGIIDLVLATIICISLLYTYFGNEKIVQEL